jgi:MFS family permease
LSEERASAQEQRDVDTGSGRSGGIAPGRAAWSAVLILNFAYVLLFFDRQLFAFLVDPIKADLGISDFQFSLINGAAIGVLAGLLGILLARIADNHNRRDAIAVSVAFWSLMTVLASRASGFIVLLMARMGVSASQALLVPASVSLIADAFSAQRRPLAINIFWSGAYIAPGLALALSGFIGGLISTAEGLTLPLSGNFSPWQLALLFLALASIVVLALMRHLQEPERRNLAKLRRAVSMNETFDYLRTHWFVYLSLIVGAALSTVGMFAMYAWVPAIYMRIYDWHSADIGIVFGLMLIVCGTAGLLVSGNYAVSFIREGQKLVFQRLMMLSVACGIIPGALTMITDTAFGMWACFAAVIFFLAMPAGLAQSAIVAITPNRMRAQLIAVYIAALSIIGLGLGPAAVAFMTDFVFRDGAAVDRSLGIVIVVSGVASVLLLALGVKQYEEKGRGGN